MLAQALAAMVSIRCHDGAVTTRIGGRLSSPDCRPPPSCRPRLDSVAVELGLRERWGEAHPRIPPSLSSAFALVRAWLGCLGESEALMTRCKRPAQRAFLDNVELGGIEPLEIVWLSVDLCCSVVVSCDDAV